MKEPRPRCSAQNMKPEKIKNKYQLIYALIILVVDIYASYSGERIILTIALVITVIFAFTFENYFQLFLDYRKSINWQKGTNKYLLETAKYENPATIATKQIEFNRGKKRAYEDVLEKINKNSQNKSSGLKKELSSYIENILESLEALQK